MSGVQHIFEWAQQLYFFQQKWWLYVYLKWGQWLIDHPMSYLKMQFLKCHFLKSETNVTLRRLFLLALAGHCCRDIPAAPVLSWYLSLWNAWCLKTDVSYSVAYPSVSEWKLICTKHNTTMSKLNPDRCILQKINSTGIWDSKTALSISFIYCITYLVGVYRVAAEFPWSY